MSPMQFVRPAAGLALGVCLAAAAASAQDGPREVKHVFVIAMENHNWTQPNGNVGATSGIQQIYQNPSCPFINSLVNGTAQTNIDGRLVNISQHVAYANAYHNVLATPSGNNPHIHPSEPNYLWAEAGTNFGVANDNDPYAPSGPTVQTTHQHLTNLLQKSGHSWRSYQEDIDLETNAGGNLVNVPLPRNQWTVPLTSQHGTFDPASPLNEYNDTLQYNYAAKHNPQVFFTDTNGNGVPTALPDAQEYAPLQQLQFDLANDRVADYNWITPNQYNDQHSGLTNGFAGLTGDAGQLKAGDNALARLVPMIMASKAYKDGGAIILWWDEAEAEDASDTNNGDDFNHTIGEIVISNLARANEGGLPYASTLDFTHSSDLKTMQEIFHVGPLLGDAATPGTNDLSDLFAPGVIPSHVGGDHDHH